MGRNAGDPAWPSWQRRPSLAPDPGGGCPRRTHRHRHGIGLVLGSIAFRGRSLAITTYSPVISRAIPSDSERDLRLACSAARRVENFVDFSHFPWVHPGILGDRAKPLSPEHAVIDDGRTISFDIALEEPGASVKGDAAPGAVVQREPTTYTLHLPLSVTLDQRLSATADRPEGHRFLLFVACSPLGARRCRSFTWNARTYRLDPAADAELGAFQAVILDQGRPIAESQLPEELPVDLSAELHIAGPDRASIAYRRRLAELAARCDRPDWRPAVS